MSSPTTGNEVTTTDYTIIGAGLSGLTAAYYLNERFDLQSTMIEARDRVGGRINTSQSVDLGATWFGSDHDNLLNLLEELGVEPFPQYQHGKGIFIHSAAEPPHYFNTDENSSSTYRITGGSSRLIDKLKKQCQPKIELGLKVRKIADKNTFIEITTDKKIYRTEKVIVTIPPQLVAQTIGFVPSLSDELTGTMESTHTWMSNAIKVGLTFESPFWRKKDLSGTLIAPNGPVIELYDHSERDESRYALMGFANEALRIHSAEKRKQKILAFLSSHFGDGIYDFQTYTEKDWLDDSFTSTSLSQSIYMHPDYGNAAWEKSYMNGKLLFSGSETSSTFGGYMEGAVAAGKRAVAFINSG